MDVLFGYAFNTNIPIENKMKQNKTKQDLLISKLHNKLFCILGYFSFFSLFPSLPLLDIIFSAVPSQRGEVMVLGNRKPPAQEKSSELEWEHLNKQRI